MMFTFFLGSCRVELSFSCFALLAFCCLFAGGESSAFFLLAALLHEASHLAALFLLRAPPVRCRLSALGCRLEVDPARALSFRQSALVSLSGPVANLLCFLLCASFGQGISAFGSANFALGAFHLLPVEPLDGGLALRAFLTEKLGVSAAGKLAAVCSVLVLLPLSVLGFLILLRTRYNFSLLSLCVYLMLYLVLKQDFFS